MMHASDIPNYLLVTYIQQSTADVLTDVFAVLFLAQAPTDNKIPGLRVSRYAGK